VRDIGFGAVRRRARKLRIWLSSTNQVMIDMIIMGLAETFYRLPQQLRRPKHARREEQRGNDNCENGSA